MGIMGKLLYGFVSLCPLCPLWSSAAGCNRADLRKHRHPRAGNGRRLCGRGRRCDDDLVEPGRPGERRVLQRHLEFDRVEEPSSTRARAFALTVPSLGLSYYRLALSGMRPPDPTEPPAASREDQGVLSQFGATVGQSVGAHLVLASTLKLVRALRRYPCRPRCRGHGDVRRRARRRWRSRTSGRRSSPTASERLELPRQVRPGVALKPGRPAAPRSRRPSMRTSRPRRRRSGDARHLATGVEAGWGTGRSGSGRVSG